MVKKGACKALGRPAPRINALLADGISEECRYARANATSWQALERMYNYRFGVKPGLMGKIDDFWQGGMNPQAVRNRLKIARRELRQVIAQFSEPEIRILSLAAGSARSVIETIAACKHDGIRVVCLLMDIDPSALMYAKNLAESLNVADQIQVTETNAYLVAKIARRFRPHIIEMMGLLDYLEQPAAIRLATKIRESLPPGGFFLTCNIYPNIERYFLRWVIDWPMVYRTPKTLAEVITKAGFADYRLVAEPLNIHGVIVAREAYALRADADSR
jgi:hypothetical protein